MPQSQLITFRCPSDQERGLDAMVKSGIAKNRSEAIIMQLMKLPEESGENEEDNS